LDPFAPSANVIISEADNNRNQHDSLRLKFGIAEFYINIVRRFIFGFAKNKGSQKLRTRFAGQKRSIYDLALNYFFQKQTLKVL